MQIDRAKQFMPFASLRGFDQMVKEKEKVLIEKRELSEGESRELSEKLSSLKIN